MRSLIVGALIAAVHANESATEAEFFGGFGGGSQMSFFNDIGKNDGWFNESRGPSKLWKVNKSNRRQPLTKSASASTFNHDFGFFNPVTNKKPAPAAPNDVYNEFFSGKLGPPSTRTTSAAKPSTPAQPAQTTKKEVS